MPSIGGKPITRIRPSVKFYKHQSEGIVFITKAGNIVLADDMGLGKSLQALAVGAIDFERGIAKRILIVTLATLKGNWAEEIEAHTTFEYEVLNNKSTRAREKQLREFQADVLIVNYEQVISCLDALNEMAFDVIIYDEAHAIKNRTSKRSRACLKLIGKRHIVVTGSPILNQVNDLWTLLHRVDPDQWPNYWRFRNRHCVFGGYMGKAIIGVKNEKELHEQLSRVMLRRLKSEVLDLPEKQPIKVWVDLAPEQRRIYDQIKDDEFFGIDPNTEDPMVIENALVKFLRLKEVCGSAGTIEGSPDISAKLDRVVEIIREVVESNEPVVVFTQFRKVQEFLGRRLYNAELPVWLMNGDTPMAERVPMINDWTKAAAQGNYGALVAMYQVGGVGLNMTAASRVILVDKLFTPKLNEQAVDRVHRIGVNLTRPVQIYELICRKTIEQRVEKILEGKDAVFSAVIEGAEPGWKRALVHAVLSHDSDDDDDSA